MDGSEDDEELSPELEVESLSLLELELSGEESRELVPSLSLFPFPPGDLPERDDFEADECRRSSILCVFFGVLDLTSKLGTPSYFSWNGLFRDSSLICCLKNAADFSSEK